MPWYWSPLSQLYCSDWHLNAPYQAWTTVCVFCHGIPRTTTCGSDSWICIVLGYLQEVEMNLWHQILWHQNTWDTHYIDVIMTTMASQSTSLTAVYSTVYSDTDQRKYQRTASLAFVWGIHRGRWIPRTKVQLRGKCFHLMTSSWIKSFWLSIEILACIADNIPMDLFENYQSMIVWSSNS